MRAFITGVTGFAGSHLAEHLLAAGDTVLGCSQKGQWDACQVGETCAQIRLLAWDVASGVTSQVQEQVAAFQPDVLYHLAAISIPADCGSDEPTPQAVSVNVDGTRSVVELCQALDRQPRMLYSSTCYVYAPVTADNAIVNEGSPLGPPRGYGKTKLAAEEVLRDATSNSGVDAIIARSFQHTGPRQSPRMILPDWVTQLLRTSDPIRAICLDTYLDLTDVRDIVRAYRRLALDGISGSVYNVGSGLSRKSGDILKIMQASAGSDREVIELEPGHRQHPIADNSRLREQTGWRPEIPLERTIEDTLDFWRQRGTDS